MSSTAITSGISLFFIFLIIFPSFLLTAIPVPILGLDAFLVQQYRIDPQSFNDSFISLPSSLKKSLSQTPLPAIAALYASIFCLDVSVSVHVKLVGSSFSTSSPSILHSFLSASISSDRFHTISNFDHLQNHDLPIRHLLQLDVSLSHLSDSLHHAIATEIAETASNFRSPLHSISYHAVDRIIKRDFEGEKPVRGVHIYLLNLGAQSKPYAYNYGTTEGESSSSYTNCMGSIWTGNERYVWVDLGAGPVNYGPSLSGDGVLPRGEFHPMAVLHGHPKSEKAVLADLASIVYSAYQVLVVPSLRIPVPYESSLVVQLIHVHDSESNNILGLDWKSVEKVFMNEIHDGLLLGDQSLTFKSYTMNFAQCPVCSFAISRSTNSYTSRFLFDNYTLIVSEYLDSKRLHQILSDSAEEFRKIGGFPEDESSRVLPVYVFDLNYNSLLLLDRYHQSVSFKDMVIAVRTKNTQTVSDYSCNGKHVFTHTRELERPLVGSILQSMWGVAPTHLLWSSSHNSTLVDYTWSVGQTPFGPFSDTSSLSFVQKDAARRNLVLTSLNFTITSAIDVLQSLAVHGGHQALLKQHRHVEFVQRWNFLKYKLDKSVSALSHLEFGMALFYVRSADHDLYAIHSLVYDASQELEASLVCFRDPPFPWGWVSMSTLGFFAMVYMYAKRRKIFMNKRKRF